MLAMANLQAFVTDALTKCLKVLISLIASTSSELNHNCNTASRSLNTLDETKQSPNVKGYMHQHTSTSINMHQQNRMHTSTAC
jgi:hypothetical protein